MGQEDEWIPWFRGGDMREGGRKIGGKCRAGEGGVEEVPRRGREDEGEGGIVSVWYSTFTRLELWLIVLDHILERYWSS